MRPAVRGLRAWCAGGDDDPYPLSFRHLDNRSYYMVDREDGAHLLNYSGCGNTVSANNDIVRRLIVDSLRMCGLFTLPRPCLSAVPTCLPAAGHTMLAPG